jgi:hypothetical protein
LLGYYFTRASEIAVGVCTADPKCVHAVGLLRGVHMKVALVPLTFSTWCGAVVVARGGPPMSTPKPEGVRTASTASSAEGDRQGAFDGRIRQWANDFHAQFVGLYRNRACRWGGIVNPGMIDYGQRCREGSSR